ncbi:MAG: hypothetical protein HYV63_05360 [Candidatus Schekmanbacteria bacterium]|nr:hypothetical protein [Candidatus Schekmanbacteria bacterium]
MVTQVPRPARNAFPLALSLAFAAITIAILSGLSALQLSCQSDVTVSAADPAVIVLTVDPPQIAAGGGSSAIEVVVTDNSGNAVADDTQVYFTTSLGTLNPVSALTKIGIARTTLTSGADQGTAVVTATSGAVRAWKEIEITGTTTPEIGSILVTANPSRLPADGVSTSAIWAQVDDTAGQPMTDGVTVLFSTSLGAITSSATTADGVATAVLTAGTTAGNVVVTAIAKSITASTYLTFSPLPKYTATPTATRTITPTRTPTPTITMTPTPGDDEGVGSIELLVVPDVLSPDGVSQSVVWATVRGLSGNLIADGRVVSFITNLGTITSSATTTDGLAKATYTAPVKAGTAEITVYVSGVTATIQVEIIGPTATPTATHTPTPFTPTPISRSATEEVY